jgi:hypothetical protein
MASTRRAKKSRTATPEVAESSTDSATGDRAVTKVDAVRAALAEGFEKPEAGVDFIRQRFGIEIGRQHFSAIKSREKKLHGAARSGRPGRPRKVVIARTGPSGGRVELLTDLEAVKRLVAQHGAANVKRMVDLLG